MKLLKVLKPGLISPFQKYQFKRNKLYTCHNFDTNKRISCGVGFYATDFDGLNYSYRKGLCVWECEVSGKSVEINPFKRRYEHFKLLRKLSISEIKQGLIDNSTKAGYNLLETSFPINPLTGKPKKMEDKYLKLLKVFDSVYTVVRDSVRGSVKGSIDDYIGDSVWDSVGNSVIDAIRVSVSSSIDDYVRDSVRYYVGESVWVSISNSVKVYVWGSIWAYISSFFYNIKHWKYINHKKGVNPFQSGIDLWKSGIVPSFNGNIWKLHSGKNAEIIWKGKINEN